MIYLRSLSNQKMYVTSEVLRETPFFGHRDLPTHWGPRKVHWCHGQHTERGYNLWANTMAHSKRLTNAGSLEALPTFRVILLSPVSHAAIVKTVRGSY